MEKEHTGSGSVVDVDYINPFIRSAIELYKNLLDMDIKREQLFKIKGYKVIRQAIKLGFTGFLNGFVVYDFSKNLSREIAYRLMPGFSNEELMRFEKSAILEFANLITGKASSMLSGLTEKIEVFPPTMIKGPYKLVLDGIGFGVSFSSNYGKMNVIIHIKY
jgi:chemotaxis protein CheX